MQKSPQRVTAFSTTRLVSVAGVIAVLYVAVIVRLFFIQVVAHASYQVQADRQHLGKSDTAALRGEIFARDHTSDASPGLYQLAVNKKLYDISLNPSLITQPANTAEVISKILGLPYDDVFARAKKEHDVYEPIKDRVAADVVDQLTASGLPGINVQEQVWRYYPDGDVGSQVLGFYGSDGDTKKGKYGIEGYWDKELAGLTSQALVPKDSKGNIIPESEKYFNLTADGSDVVLTIDRTIQFKACDILKRGMDRFAADQATVIVEESHTGKILAMCGYPSFDPNNYGKVKSISDFNNNAVFEAYEPGSVFKPIAMAAAIDQHKVTPDTTYTDTGEVKIDTFTIRNFDKKAHGVNTMTQVLQQSLNTGIIFATKTIPNNVFTNYVKQFGFGTTTGVETSQEVAGSLGALEKNRDIYKATASFGQGITVTPLQMLNGINALANDGVLVRPYIVDEIRHVDGSVVTTQPKQLRQVVSKAAAETLTAMLTRVVEEGYDSKATVKGYYLAGKTGTAQVAEDGKYRDKTNHTFVGYGPAENPKFSVLIKMYNVKNVGFAADSTTPLFSELAKFLLEYYHIPPTR